MDQWMTKEFSSGQTETDCFGKFDMAAHLVWVDKMKGVGPVARASTTYTSSSV